MRGVVAKFLPDRYFGFITRDDARPAIFFHGKDVQGAAVTIGDHVSFDVDVDQHGRPCARNVMRVEVTDEGDQ